MERRTRRRKISSLDVSSLFFISVSTREDYLLDPKREKEKGNPTGFEGKERKRGKTRRKRERGRKQINQLMIFFFAVPTEGLGTWISLSMKKSD